MDLKQYMLKFDPEKAVTSAADKFLVEMKAFMKAWGDPDDVGAGSTKKAYLDFLAQVQFKEQVFMALAGVFLSDDISGNCRDVLSVMHGIGSPAVRAYDVYKTMDARLDPVNSGKGYADPKVAAWVGIGDGKTSGEILELAGPEGKKADEAKGKAE